MGLLLLCDTVLENIHLRRHALVQQHQRVDGSLKRIENREGVKLGL